MENGKEVPYQGKALENFEMLPTQGTLCAYVLNSLIQKIKDIVVFATQFHKFSNWMCLPIQFSI